MNICFMHPQRWWQNCVISALHEAAAGSDNIGKAINVSADKSAGATTIAPTMRISTDGTMQAGFYP